MIKNTKNWLKAIGMVLFCTIISFVVVVTTVLLIKVMTFGMFTILATTLWFIWLVLLFKDIFDNSDAQGDDNEQKHEELA